MWLLVTSYWNFSQYVLVNSKSYYSWKFGLWYEKTISIVFYSNLVYKFKVKVAWKKSKITKMRSALKAERIFVIASFCSCFVLFCAVLCFFCFFFWLLGEIKDLWLWIHQFYFLIKPQDYSFPQKCSFKCLYKIIELNQSGNEL